MRWSILCCLYFLSLSAALFTQHQNREAVISNGICGTGSPSLALKDAHRRFASTDSQRVVTTDNDEKGKPKNIEVETYFHVVSSNDQVNQVTNEMIALQFVYLERAYANTSISYRLLGIDRSINDTWARNGDDREMKRALRRGSYSSLNVYFQTDLKLTDSTHVDSRPAGLGYGAIDTRDMQSPPNLLGFCTLPDPRINASSSVEDYVDDGCNILAATMPGGSIPHYSSGGTTVHEVGHWHGLLHVFQGESCSPDNEGDYIADTPQQSMATEGCPAFQDSCPDSPGLDSIHNFMDYSSDDCYQSFTKDQAGRMRNMWLTMREGK